MRTSMLLHGLQFFALLVVLPLSCTLVVYDQLCGNGVIDPGEVCDPGNHADRDGCSADCKRFEGCGNAAIDPGEVCDDGNRIDGDGCSADCKSTEICGNGIIDLAVGEQCDTGGPSPMCNPNCTISRCGDGMLNVLAGEQCDTGGSDSASCNGLICTLPRCGDNYVNRAAGEVCDDGNTINGDGCENDCTSTP